MSAEGAEGDPPHSIRKCGPPHGVAPSGPHVWWPGPAQWGCAPRSFSQRPGWWAVWRFNRQRGLPAPDHAVHANRRAEQPAHNTGWQWARMQAVGEPHTWHAGVAAPVTCGMGYKVSGMLRGFAGADSPPGASDVGLVCTAP